MNKGELVELLQRHMAGGEVPADVRGKYHENVIAKYLELGWNNALWELAKVSMATRDMSTLDQYVKNFDIDKSDIKCDSKSKEFYIDLPATVPQIMGGQAIRYVGPSGKGGRGWLYRNPTANDIFNELDVNLVDQSPRFLPSSDRITLNNILETNFPDCIRVKMITGFSEYDDDDDIPMPGGQDGPIFASIVQMLASSPREELRNDNEINVER